MRIENNGKEHYIASKFHYFGKEKANNNEACMNVV
jgi:hypothetical protein